MTAQLRTFLTAIVPFIDERYRQHFDLNVEQDLNDGQPIRTAWTIVLSYQSLEFATKRSDVDRLFGNFGITTLSTYFESFLAPSGILTMVYLDDADGLWIPDALRPYLPSFLCQDTSQPTKWCRTPYFPWPLTYFRLMRTSDLSVDFLKTLAQHDLYASSPVDADDPWKMSTVGGQSMNARAEDIGNTWRFNPYEAALVGQKRNSSNLLAAWIDQSASFVHDIVLNELRDGRRWDGFISSEIYWGLSYILASNGSLYWTTSVGASWCTQRHPQKCAFMLPIVESLLGDLAARSHESIIRLAPAPNPSLSFHALPLPRSQAWQWVYDWTDTQDFISAKRV